MFARAILTGLLTLGLIMNSGQTPQSKNVPGLMAVSSAQRGVLQTERPAGAEEIWG